ncbi:hypothetical protein LIER_35203 [Lithospermum erythrorhizon]|uniref:Uncharacterized protein n=1 Tax=Lithospermum erythrorhizon TaxID=34254 RepID=A0AAV3NLK5_LITER
MSYARCLVDVDVSKPPESVNLSTVNGSLSEAAGSEDMVISLSKNGKGLKGVGKGKTIISQILVVSPNSFDALNVMGGGGLVAFMMRMLYMSKWVT